MATGSELQRTCAPLYPSFALESFASLLLFFFFAYLSILISSKQQIKKPGQAMCKFACHHLSEWWHDTGRILSRWSEMHEMDLGQRFRFCRRLNATICRFSAAASLLAVTRWFHVNNVNGFRYLGYAMTCPMMQAELVLLIAPIVPCYRTVVRFSSFITFMMLVGGYVSSQYDMDLYVTGETDVILHGHLENLTLKGKMILPSVFILGFLSFVQIPILALLYCMNGGGSSGKLPEGYLTLLAITSITWLGFPVWWYLSYEGMGYIKDSKLNGIGFVLLNVLSKGWFTLQMISIVKTWKRNNQGQQAAPAKPSDLDMLNHDSDDEDGQLASQAHQRSKVVHKTGQSLAWMIKGLQSWDKDGKPPPETELTSEAAPEKTILLDTSRISDERMFAELGKRMHMQFSSGGGDDKEVGHDAFKSSLDDEIRMACAQFAVEEDSD